MGALQDHGGYHAGIYTEFRNTPVIRPELYEGGNFKPPMIYDLYGLSALKDKYDSIAAARIEDVVSYILTSDYHTVVVHKYGILASDDRKYYSMGWDVRKNYWF